MMETELIEEPICGVCHRPRSWHDRDSVRHEFNITGHLVAKREFIPPDMVERASLPLLKGDPILRLLLIRKGIVTIEEIEQVEKELKATGLVQTTGVGYAGPITRSSGKDLEDSKKHSRD